MSEKSLIGARSILFVPGDRPDRFGKAVATGADYVVLDLEDAVAPESKPDARRAVSDWLKTAPPNVIVRVNPPATPWYAEDVAAVPGVPVMLPKAQDPAEVAALAAELGPNPQIIPLVETALGIHRATEVCAAAGVVRPAFGSVDLAAELGVDPADNEALRYARSALVLAARAAGAGAPIDGVTTAVRDDGTLLADSAHALSLGCTAKLCIHPAQVEPVSRAFAPTAGEVEWARKVLVAAGAGGVAVLDGKLIDRPVELRARAILLRAGESDFPR
ncbi:CoA ester lyase [Saccharopolyspora sp. ID03-671]|uniref:HpcH/HpaI aldolase/citrate lyase family protein n=1 Tax=Saccharopolyspora sp. ID03-671 TaxID=3073066 RepID=UPI003246801B